MTQDSQLLIDIIKDLNQFFQISSLYHCVVLVRLTNVEFRAL